MKRIAKVSQTYAGRMIEAGEEFKLIPNPGQSAEDHARFLLLLGRIEPQKGDPGYIAPKRPPKIDTAVDA